MAQDCADRTMEPPLPTSMGNTTRVDQVQEDVTRSAVLAGDVGLRELLRGDDTSVPLLQRRSRACVLRGDSSIARVSCK